MPCWCWLCVGLHLLGWNLNGMLNIECRQRRETQVNFHILIIAVVGASIACQWSVVRRHSAALPTAQCLWISSLLNSAWVSSLVYVYHVLVIREYRSSTSCLPVVSSITSIALSLNITTVEVGWTYSVCYFWVVNILVTMTLKYMSWVDG